MRIILKCDVGRDIGTGHFYRCNLLKAAFKKKGIDAYLAVQYLEENPIILYHDIRIHNDDELHDILKKLKFSALVLDVFHSQNHNNSNISEHLKNFKKYAKIAFIDGLFDDQCPTHFYKYIDILITPYVQLVSKKDHINHLHGKDFLMMDSSRLIQGKTIHQNANHLLLTFGGSDPWNQTVETLQKLTLIDATKQIDVRVVIGPCMAKDKIEQCQEFIKYFKNLDLIFNAQDLRNCFEWADLAITNTGQTRYELAASGIPFIILPFDKEGYNKSIIFVEVGAANLSSHLCGEEILELLKDHTKRQQMSANGIKYFYNQDGINNLAKKIVEVLQ